MTRGRSVARGGVAAIFAGGFLGAITRAELVEALPADSARWPWATFVVNIAGAFTLAYVVTRLRDRAAAFTNRRLFLGTGFCGALTTFSTMQIELLRMLDDDRYALAGAYALASVVAGLGAVAVATRLPRGARPKP